MDLEPVYGTVFARYAGVGIDMSLDDLISLRIYYLVSKDNPVLW